MSDSEMPSGASSPDDPEHGEQWSDFRTALDNFENAAFAWGAWTPNDDRPYEDVSNALRNSRVDLYAALGLAIEATVTARMQTLAAGFAHPLMAPDANPNAYGAGPAYMVGIDWAREPNASVEVEVTPDGPAPYGRSHESRWMHVSGAHPPPLSHLRGEERHAACSCPGGGHPPYPSGDCPVHA